jgi:hypothetical protein
MALAGGSSPRVKSTHSSAEKWLILPCLRVGEQNLSRFIT